MIGIYKISNKVNNKFYIGSSEGIEKRWYQHKSYLKKNTHPNQKLQNSFNKHGEENFIFEVLEECEVERLIEREQYYIDILKPQFNIREIAVSNKGIKISNTSNMKKAAKLRGERCSRKVLLYNLDGSFHKECKSIVEASFVCEFEMSATVSNALKSKSGKCGKYIVKKYDLDYPLQISSYKREINFSETGKRNRINGIRKAHIGKIVSDNTKILLSKAKLGKPSLKREPLFKVDRNDNIIETYESSTEAWSKEGRTPVLKSLRYGSYTRNGFKFIKQNKII